MTEQLIFIFQPEARYNKEFKIPPQLNQNLTLDNFLTHFSPLHLPYVHSRASLVAQMVKNPPANAGNMGSTLGSGRSPGENNGNPLQYFCLGNPLDRGAWQGSQRVRHDSVTEEQRQQHVHTQRVKSYGKDKHLMSRNFFKCVGASQWLRLPM